MNAEVQLQQIEKHRTKANWTGLIMTALQLAKVGMYRFARKVCYFCEYRDSNKGFIMGKGLCLCDHLYEAEGLPAAAELELCFCEA